MSKESYYLYLTDREMRICMAAIMYQLVQIPDVEKELRGELMRIAERMAEETSK